jgi:hypothetical protein
MIISRSVLLRMRNVSDKGCRENHSTHFVFQKKFFFSRKSYSSSDNVEKKELGRAKQSTNDIITRRMRFACWITKGYRHTPSTCNTYCYSTATMVTRTRLNITFIRIIGCKKGKVHSCTDTEALYRPYGP